MLKKDDWNESRGMHFAPLKILEKKVGSQEMRRNTKGLLTSQCIQEFRKIPWIHQKIFKWVSWCDVSEVGLHEKRSFQVDRIAWPMLFKFENTLQLPRNRYPRANTRIHHVPALETSDKQFQVHEDGIDFRLLSWECRALNRACLTVAAPR